jgi:hypothetical protein
MKTLKTAAVALALMAGMTASAAVYAQHRGGGHFHGHFHSGVRLGVFVGGPAFWYPGPYYYGPSYYPPYYPYYPPAAFAPTSPPVYVEQDQQAPAGSPPPVAAQAYWYYCAESQAYYPYVNQCAGQWQRVAPQPPAS